MALSPDTQDEIRREMMPWALQQFDWERYADQWQAWAAQDAYVRGIEKECDKDLRSVRAFCASHCTAEAHHRNCLNPVGVAVNA